MKKQKRSQPEVGLFVQVVLVCTACGADIGNAFRLTGQHPRAGQEMVDGTLPPGHL